MTDELNGLGSEWEANRRLVTLEMRNVRRLFRGLGSDRDGGFMSVVMFEIVRVWPWTVI